MTCSPDWPRTLRRASFRGARFHVETDEIHYGRRIKTHEFPNRDRPFQEDLGEAAITYSVTAYVASDNVLAEKAALVDACRRRGAGRLVLPTEGSISVVCKSCSRSQEKDRMGYIAFSLEFLEGGAGFGVVASVISRAAIALLAVDALSIIQSLFLDTYAVSGSASWVLSSSSLHFRTWLSAVDDARLSATLTAEGGANLAQAIDDAFADAPAIAAIDVGAREDGVKGETIAEAASRIAKLVTAAAPTPVAAAEIFAGMLPFAYADPFPIDGVQGARVASNDEITELALRATLLVEMAVAIAEADFDMREAAINTRARFSEAFGQVLDRVTGDNAAVLQDVRGKAVDVLSARIIDLRPTITVQSQASSPSIVWAYRLYADAARQVDLVNRNQVRHPSYMPNDFEAEAP